MATAVELQGELVWFLPDRLPCGRPQHPCCGMDADSATMRGGYDVAQT